MIYGIGKYEIGKFKSKEKGKQTKVYDTWYGMIRRCYSVAFHKKHPTYIGCSVDERWHNFQVFAEWFEQNYVEGWDLDKDILFKGNKVYSPETCCFVPQEVNSLLIKCDKARGEYPVGVSLDKKSGKYKAYLNLGKSSQTTIGRYNSTEQAFLAYKKAKEEYIREIAEKWKSKITKLCYLALLSYRVEIND